MVEALDPNWRGVLNFVCKHLRNTVAELEGPGAKPRPLRLAEMVKGSDALMKWARALGCPWGPGSQGAMVAAKHGSIGALELMTSCDQGHPTGCRLSWCVHQEAAKWGRLDVISWLDSKDIDFEHVMDIQMSIDSEGGTCANAAAGGHLLCLWAAKELGAPWSGETLRRAAQAGHLEVR